MNNDELLETVRKCIEKWFSDYGEDVHHYASNLVGRASVGDETADPLVGMPLRRHTITC